MLKSGAFVVGVDDSVLSSATAKFIISTILETSFLILSGSTEGKDLPTSFKLQRYMASANSGNSSCPERVVSARVLFST
jgi:hypothetical protein